jgi:hypothetical protein
MNRRNDLERTASRPSPAPAPRWTSIIFVVLPNGAAHGLVRARRQQGRQAGLSAVPLPGGDHHRPERHPLEETGPELLVDRRQAVPMWREALGAWDIARIAHRLRCTGRDQVVRSAETARRGCLYSEWSTTHETSPISFSEPESGSPDTTPWFPQSGFCNLLKAKDYLSAGLRIVTTSLRGTEVGMVVQAPYYAQGIVEAVCSAPPSPQPFDLRRHPLLEGTA